MTNTRQRRTPSVRSVGMDDLHDDQLVTAVRNGRTEAFGELYARYAQRARLTAAQLSNSYEYADDIVAEAFTVLFERFSAGDESGIGFWPDLLTEMRAVISRTPTDTTLTFTDQVEIPGSCLSDARLESLGQEHEYALAAAAFARQHTRSRKLLRCLLIQGMSVESIAVVRQVDPYVLAKAAMRATETLRVAYLQAHVPPPVSPACIQPSDRLAAWLCGRLSQQPREQVSRHVADCVTCARITGELTDLLGRMRHRVRQDRRPMTSGKWR